MKTMVLIHPGSLFGALDTEYGKRPAWTIRDAILWRDLTETRHLYPDRPVVVLKGWFYEEYENTLLHETVERDRPEPIEIDANPDEMESLGVAAEAVSEVVPTGTLCLTGAWVDHNDYGQPDVSPWGNGCVNSLAYHLASQLGRDVEISPFAARVCSKREHNISPEKTIWWQVGMSVVPSMPVSAKVSEGVLNTP